MLRRNSILFPRYANAFTMFLIHVSKHPEKSRELNSLPFKKRGELIGFWYHSLSPDDRAKLADLGKAVEWPARERRPKRAYKGQPGDFALFVKKAYKTEAVHRLPNKSRLRAIANLYYRMHPNRKKKRIEQKKSRRKLRASDDVKDQSSKIVSASSDSKNEKKEQLPSPRKRASATKNKKQQKASANINA